MMKTPIYGDLEPSHVLAKAAELQRHRVLQPSGETPWISKAPKFEGEKDFENPSWEFRSWLQRERPRRYQALTSKGEIVLIQNPDAWEWVILPDKRLKFLRPLPQQTGETLAPLKSSSWGNQ